MLPHHKDGSHLLALALICGSSASWSAAYISRSVKVHVMGNAAHLHLLQSMLSLSRCPPHETASKWTAELQMAPTESSQ